MVTSTSQTGSKSSQLAMLCTGHGENQDKEVKVPALEELRVQPGDK